MNMMDLHMHSCFSGDGELTPKELVTKCEEKDLSCFALADHNCVSGVKELLAMNRRIKVIPAVELDCVFENREFHLLGYGIDVENPIYHDIEMMVLKQEQESSAFRIRYARENLHLDFTDEEMEKAMVRGVITGEDILDVCLKNGRNNDKEIILPYLPGGARSVNPLVNFYWDYFSFGKAGHTGITYPTMKLYINMIHEQGGLAVLAHPGNNVKEDAKLLENIIALGIDGLEVYSSYHTNEQIAYYRKVAKKHNLLITCGSDFHGRTKPAISIGQCEMSAEEYATLRKTLLRYEK